MLLGLWTFDVKGKISRFTFLLCCFYKSILNLDWLKSSIVVLKKFIDYSFTSFWDLFVDFLLLILWSIQFHSLLLRQILSSWIEFHFKSKPKEGHPHIYIELSVTLSYKFSFIQHWSKHRLLVVYISLVLLLYFVYSFFWYFYFELYDIPSPFLYTYLTAQPNQK